MRQCAGVGVAVGVWQTILPVLSRPLISVTRPVICAAGSTWHFLSQRQYARTHVQPLMYADTHGGTQPCTPIHVCPAFPRDTKGHCRDAPPWQITHRRNTLNQEPAYLCTHRYTQGQTHTQVAHRGPRPWSHPDRGKVLCRSVNS